MIRRDTFVLHVQQANLVEGGEQIDGGREMASCLAPAEAGLAG